MQQDTDKIAHWKGKPVTELTREELLEVVEWCSRDILRREEELQRWMAACDPAKYLMNKSV